MNILWKCLQSFLLKIVNIYAVLRSKSCDLPLIIASAGIHFISKEFLQHQQHQQQQKQNLYKKIFSFLKEIRNIKNKHSQQKHFSFK